MAPLFDQDSTPSGENRLSQGVGAATAGQRQAQAPEEPSEERTSPDGSDTLGPGPGGREGDGDSGPGSGVDGAETKMETEMADDRVGDGDTNPPAVSGAGPGDATDVTTAADAIAAPDGIDEGAQTVASSDEGAGVGALDEQVESDRAAPEAEQPSPGDADPWPTEPAPAAPAAAEPEAPAVEPEAPAAAIPPETAEPEAPAAAIPSEGAHPDAPSATAPADPETPIAVSAESEAPAPPIPSEAAEPETPTAPTPTAPPWPLPPPPTAEPVSGAAEAEAPAAAATPAPAWPLPPAAASAEPMTEPELTPAAPSSAGPAPSRLEPPRPPPAGVAGRLQSVLRLLAHWPSPVRASPDQRAYSLVMLLVLAVTVGVVGAGVLVALVFIVVGALGG